MILEEKPTNSSSTSFFNQTSFLTQMKPDDFNDVQYTDNDSQEKAYNENDYCFVNPNWVINEIKNGTLKKHPAANVMFKETSILDTQKSVLKGFRVSPEWLGSFTTGLYAPAGEVITMRFSADQLEKLKDTQIRITAEWQTIKRNDNKNETTFRFPKMETAFNIGDMVKDTSTYIKEGDKIVGYELKFASVFGGAISFRFDNSKTNQYQTDRVFEIEDAVEHLNWVEGFTTKEEWNRLAKTTRTPIMTISNDNSTIFKPTFKDAEDNTYFLDLAQTETPALFAKYFGILAKMSEFMSSRDILGRRINNAIYIGDFVAAGVAINHGAAYISAPLSWGDNILDSDYKMFSAKNSWGTFHELNHSYEWNQFGPQHPGEVVNNVNSMIELMVLDQSMVDRDETNTIGFAGIRPGKEDWQGKVSPYISLYGQRNSSGSWKTSEDNWNAWAQYVHIVGLKVAMGLIRMLSSNSNTRYEYISSNNPARSIVQGLPGLETVYLMCALPGLDLTEWLENSNFYDLFTNKSDSNNVTRWTQLKTLISKQFPKYNPFATLYSSGNFLPANNKEKTSSQEWKYLGDNIKPYQVSMFEPTTFDFEKFTKFSVDVSFKEVKVINNPKFGTAKISDDKKKVIYTPINDVESNYMDELIVEITDTNNNVYRTLIRPLLTPLVLNTTSYLYKTKINGQVTIDDKQFIFDNGTNNRDDIKDYDLNAKEGDSAYKEDLRNAKLEFFFNFDNYISSIQESVETTEMTTLYSDGINPPSYDLDQNKFYRFKTLIRPERSGYYRTNFTPSGNAQHIIVAREVETNKATLLSFTDNTGNNFSGSLTKQSQNSVYLDKDKAYEIDMFTLRKIGYNNVKNATTSSLKLAYIGEQDLTNEEIEEKGLTALNCHDAFSDGFTIDKYYEKLGMTIFDEISNFKPKFYSWGLENIDFFDTIMTMNRFDKGIASSDDTLSNYVDFSSAETKYLNEQKFVDPRTNKEIDLNTLINTKDFKDGVRYNSNSDDTTLSIQLKLKKEIQIDSIQFYIPEGKGYERAKFVELFDETGISKGKFRINNWWEKSSEQIAKFNETLIFKNKMTIKFINEKDNSDDVPPNWKTEMNSQDPQKVVMSNIRIGLADKITANRVLLPTSKEVVYDKWWQSTYLDTKYNDQKMISNVKGSKITWTLKDAQSFVFYIDKGQGMGSFDVYVDGKNVGTVNSNDSTSKIGISYFNYEFENAGDHKVEIVLNGDGWVSIQGLGYEKVYNKPNW